MRKVKTVVGLSYIYGFVGNYSPPSNINYLWGFGLLAGLCLVLQMITGILLAMHYAPDVDTAWLSIHRMTYEVRYGWLLRYLHINGASAFFTIVYIHLLRGIYYGSFLYPRHTVWYIGVIILFLMIATAFLGYVLPWGQMSFWAATVITNLFSSIPIIGTYIVSWLWGGFSVDNATLNRFYALHFFLPFVILGLSILHMIMMHEVGGNNPIGIKSINDTLQFHTYFSLKDFAGFVVFLMLLLSVVFWDPLLFSHSDNDIPANPLSTPPHIVPEWYFLPFYAVLRSIPDKLGGVAGMVAAILIPLILPSTNIGTTRSGRFKPAYSIFFWGFLGSCILLTWIGGVTPEAPYITLGRVFTVYYFFFFILILPALGFLQKEIDLTNTKRIIH